MAYGPLLLALFVGFAGGPAQGLGGQTDLQVYFIDVEGGQSTLFVTPTGQSLLIDTGWPDNEGRDADRILAAAKSAGMSKIDYVLLTHYHDDHSGGVPQLVDKIPVGTFIDHGANIDTKPGDPRKKSTRPTSRCWPRESTSTWSRIRAMCCPLPA
jgi:competence protein ComEC